MKERRQDCKESRRGNNGINDDAENLVNDWQILPLNKLGIAGRNNPEAISSSSLKNLNWPGAKTLVAVTMIARSSAIWAEPR